MFISARIANLAALDDVLPVERDRYDFLPGRIEWGGEHDVDDGEDEGLVVRERCRDRIKPYPPPMNSSSAESTIAP